MPENRETEFGFLMCFPDVYEIAMSNLGIQILYDIINKTDGFRCERCFAPWPDMGKALAGAGAPLFSLESGAPAGTFDLVGFSLQSELSYTDVLYMLSLAGIPFARRDRGADAPLVIAGGPCCVNPAPIEDFFDLFVIGDGEDAVPELLALYAGLKRRGGYTKALFLSEAAGITGVYAPGISRTVKRAAVNSLDAAPYPVCPLVPNIEAVHNRAVVELFRGCTRGCRFCQAGYIYRPLRARNPDLLAGQAVEILKNTGYNEISFASLSTGDYPGLQKLIDAVKSRTEHVNISLPSLRLDSFNGQFAFASRKSSLTFAPEAGTQRLRDVINKNFTEQEILNGAEAAFGQGYSSIKLYFMIGLPTETDADIDGIIDLVRRIRLLYRKKNPRLSITVSASIFVPKPFTPFQWEAMIDGGRVAQMQERLKSGLKREHAEYRYHDYESSLIETAFARGGAELGAVLLKAFENGCRFDGWSEQFSYAKWAEAFAECGIVPEDYTKPKSLAEPLPWDFVDIGVTKKFLLAERKRAYAGETTPDCRERCGGCGAERCDLAKESKV
ncbi:MAG: radical SAM protein [Firmicutes bacterium]|nr:radical SAM protein [Bacillota bacterium]